MSYPFSNRVAAALCAIVLLSGLPMPASADDEPTYTVHPNPFIDGTTFSLSMPTADSISIDIYDDIGRHVRTLYSGWRMEGELLVNWDGRDDGGWPVVPGVYLCTVSNDSAVIAIVKGLKVWSLD